MANEAQNMYKEIKKSSIKLLKVIKYLGTFVFSGSAQDFLYAPNFQHLPVIPCPPPENDQTQYRPFFKNQIHISPCYFGSCVHNFHNFQHFMGCSICFCSLPVCLDCKTFEENSMFSFVRYTIPCTMLVNKQACKRKNKFHLKHAEYLRL